MRVEMTPEGMTMAGKLRQLHELHGEEVVYLDGGWFVRCSCGWDKLAHRASPDRATALRVWRVHFETVAAPVLRGE